MQQEIRNTQKKKNALGFFVALLLGGLSIWYTKTEFDNQWYAALVAGLVVLSLAFYYMFNDEDEPEEEGDNVYYLGLLFTLGSLIFALVELFGADAVKATSAEQVRLLLENFGIALTSTVFGIFGRILVQNCQTSAPSWISFKSNRVNRENLNRISYAEGSSPSQAPDDTRRPDQYRPIETVPTDVPDPPSSDASIDDLQAFNRHILGLIARDLTQGASALARFHTIVRTHATDVQEQLEAQSKTLRTESSEFKDTLKRSATSFAQDLEEMSRKSLEVLRSSFELVATQAKDLQDETDAAQQRYIRDMQTMFEAFHTTLQESSNAILENIKQNSDLNTTQIRESSIALSSVISEVGGKLGQFSLGIDSANSASTQLSSDAQQIGQVATDLAPVLRELKSGVQDLQGGITSILSIVDSARELDQRINVALELDSSASKLQEIGESLASISEGSKKATDYVQEAAALFSDFKESVAASEKASAAATEAMLHLAEHAAAQVQELQKQKSRFRGFFRSD